MSTATLNLVLREATAWKAPPTQRGSLKKGKIYYATQVGSQRRRGSQRVVWGLSWLLWGLVEAWGLADSNGVLGLGGGHSGFCLADCCWLTGPTCGHAHGWLRAQNTLRLPVPPAPIAQAGARPPTFVFFVNDPTLFGDDYKRYMERALRDNIGLSGTPLRLLWRGKPEQEKGVVRIKSADQLRGQGGAKGGQR